MKSLGRPPSSLTAAFTLNGGEGKAHLILFLSFAIIPEASCIRRHLYLSLIYFVNLISWIKFANKSFTTPQSNNLRRGRGKKKKLLAVNIKYSSAGLLIVSLWISMKFISLKMSKLVVSFLFRPDFP